MSFYNLRVKTLYTAKDTHWEIKLPPQAYEKLAGGKPVSDWEQDLVAMYPEEFIAPDLTCTFMGTLIVSERLRAALEEPLRGSVQFLPIILECDDTGPTVEGYAIGHCIRRVACVDRERTKITVSGPEKNERFLPPLWLRLDAISSESTFKVAEQPRVLVVREDIKAIIDSIGVSEAIFEPMSVSDE